MFKENKWYERFCRIRGSLLGFCDRLSSPNARGDARDVARSCWWLLGERGWRTRRGLLRSRAGDRGLGSDVTVDAYLFIVYEL